MPSVAIAVANVLAPVIGWGAATAVGLFVVNTLPSLVASFAISYISSKLLEPDLPSFSTESSKRKQMIRSPIASHEIVYGQVLKSGPLAFAYTTGTENEYLHLVVMLAAHEVEEIGDVYFNDKLSSEYDSSLYRINKHLGADDQAADADLVAEVTEWTEDHRLRGIAYIYVRLKWDRETFATGIPTVRAVVKGKKIYDPRRDVTQWSDNWALAVRDYLTSEDGLSVSSDEIYEPSFIAAANLADEAVSIPDGAGGYTSEQRYHANGVLQLSQQPMDLMSQLLSGGVGILTYTQGQYRLFGGAYDEPAFEITEDHLIEALQVTAKTPRKQLYNGVRGIYVDPDLNWEATDFPPHQTASYVTVDGAEIWRDIELPFTTSNYTAQRIARLQLARSRMQTTVTLPLSYRALQVGTWETVRVTLSQLGWDGKIFRVADWSFNDQGGVDLSLIEESTSVYDWDADDAIIIDPPPVLEVGGVDDALSSLASDWWLKATDNGSTATIRSYIPTVIPSSVETYFIYTSIREKGGELIIDSTTDSYTRQILVTDTSPAIVGSVWSGLASSTWHEVYVQISVDDYSYAEKKLIFTPPAGSGNINLASTFTAYLEEVT